MDPGFFVGGPLEKKNGINGKNWKKNLIKLDIPDDLLKFKYQLFYSNKRQLFRLVLVGRTDI